MTKTRKIRKKITPLAVLLVITVINIQIFGLINIVQLSSFFITFHRILLQNLGDGNCSWSALNGTDTQNTGEIQGTTLIVGFPGVGKQLASSLIEQFTNRKVGDDWNIMELEKNFVAIKTSFPHPEGNWTWGDRIDQSVLVVRNPMDTLRSYHNIKLTRTNEYEIKRTNLNFWHIWRDTMFDKHMDLYSMVIEFWMDNGRRLKKGGEIYYDKRCNENMIGGCFPKAIIQYEALIDSDRGEDEALKLASVLNLSVPLVNESIWGCIYRKTMKRYTLYSKIIKEYQDSKKLFTHRQLATMKKEIQRLHDKYDEPIYSNVPVAAQLVAALKEFLVEINSAYSEASLYGFLVDISSALS